MYALTLTNGGFFVRANSHKFHDVLPHYGDYGQPGLPLDPGRFDQYSVGPILVTTNVISLPRIHSGICVRDAEE